ncbi:MAG: PrsW family intramembrane metalloprotease [Anaerolineae bacterium]|nr:PrsW family intramembrane metalloprotease [Anaerolineae bacterium]
MSTGGRICCVCHKPLADEARVLGGRLYCPDHYANVAKEHKGLWASGVVEIGAVLVFVALVALVVWLVKPQLNGPALIWAGIVLALIPAAIWMVFFYRQDRLEPEPKQYVIGVFILGMLLCNGVAIPVVNQLFQVNEWLATNTLTHIAGAILVIGITQEFLKYVAVRYSVYMTPEFDERIDGIVYGTAAGLGFAAMLNIHYVIANGGVDLTMGVIRIAVTTLAQASFAGITGFFLGRAKFQVEPVWWQSLGVVIAAVLNGLFVWARGEITQVGLNVNPWLGLLLATVVAVATFATLWALMRKANQITLLGIDAEQTLPAKA